MNKKIIRLLICLFSVTYVGYSQQTTESPYSYYGIGELNSNATIEESAMGGIGAFADTIRVNMQNPATLGKLKFTAFSAGISLEQKKIVSNITSVKSQVTAVDYVVLGFPVIKNLGIAVGVAPYSSVGYKLISEKTIDEVTYESGFEGKGNVNQVFMSAGYQIYEGLSTGIGLKLNFGKIEMTDLLNVSNIQFFTQEYNQSRLRGFSPTFGMYYEKPIKHRLKISSSLVYTPESKITSNNERVISTYAYEPGSNGVSLVEKERHNKDLAAIGLKQTKLTMPYQLELGAGVGEDRKWYVGLEYTFENTSVFSNPFLSATNITYQNGYKMAVGGFYLPQYNSFSNYWKRITYRAGLKYEKTGIVLNNTSIDDFGISFGLTLPVKSFSNITFGAEYGQKGTTSQNLIKENYFNFKIGFTLNDKWFQKTKYQ